jgi:hypothetical protein
MCAGRRLWPVHGDRGAGWLHGMELDAALRIGAKLSAQVHVGLPRVLVLVMAFA